MKRLLIIGASVLQLPAIIKAKTMGLFVGVIDFNRDAAGVKYSDIFYEVSTIDIEGVISAAKSFKPDGIMTLATDMPMRSVAAVAECLGLPGISPLVAQNATDKVAMINCFSRAKVPIPWFYAVTMRSEFETIIDQISLPFIIKPNDSSGSRGVVLVENIESALESFDYSLSKSRSGLVLVEEYLQGPEVSVEIITYEGKSEIIAVTDKLTTGSPYFVEMGHSQPSMLPKDIIDQISSVAINAVNSVGINNSPSHVEIILTKEGPKLVELGARLGGDCITSHLVPLSTGIDMVKASIDLALGIRPELQRLINKGAAIRYLSAREGKIKEISGVEKLSVSKGVKHIEILKNVGDTVFSVKGSGDRVGYVICQADTPSEAVALCEKNIKMIDITTI